MDRNYDLLLSDRTDYDEKVANIVSDYVTIVKELVRCLLDGERTLKTTDKGMNFLRIHNKVQGLTPLATKSQRREILEDSSTIEKVDTCYHHQTLSSSTVRQTPSPFIQ